MFYNFFGNVINVAYDFAGNPIAESDYRYMGGYIEIQPDSWDGSTPVTGTHVSADDSTAWGFPMSISDKNQAIIKNDIFSGDGKGIMYIRFPLGFAYRGHRNIDEDTGLAKNIGERWNGQNAGLRSWFDSISEAGGGLAPEYWCPPEYWISSGSYSGRNSIKEEKIDEFTDAIVNDLEYLHENIAPVRMFSLQNEPQYGTQPYGACRYSSDVYKNVFESAIVKIKASSILSSHNNKPNEVLFHAASSDETYPFGGIGKKFIDANVTRLWGFSHHKMRNMNGETASGADWIKSDEYINHVKLGRENVFCNEYEYFTDSKDNNFRCSNNMLRMIYEIVYGKARVLMPVIHVAKPKGQTSFNTNTKGYCLYAVDRSTGCIEVNTWAYNSWKFINDNLPIGSAYVDGGDFGMDGVGYMMMSKDGKHILFLANNTAEQKTVSLNLAYDMEGKLYSISDVGTDFGQIGKGFAEITIPAYSGIVYS